MAGLRELKKENSKFRIVASALKLFEDQGFEKTTMEKIAADAELGVGTIYNYFPSKMHILFSIIETNSGGYVEELQAVIQRGVPLREALIEFYSIYIRSFSTYGKKIWGELFAEGLFRNPDLLEMIDSVDEPFLQKLQELLTYKKRQGAIDEKADVLVISSALYALLAYNIIRYVSDFDKTEKEMIETLQSQASIFIDSIARDSR